MSNVRRRAPAILKRRNAPPTPATAGNLFATTNQIVGTLVDNPISSAPLQFTVSLDEVGTTVTNDSAVDVWELEIESRDPSSPLQKSVSTQADFPSRALTSLNHELAETCQKICPTLGARAQRDNVIDKLTEIVNDAEGSSKARFLLEQIFAYKTKMPYHSNFMTRHCKLLMDLSQKTYQHLKDVDGSGLLTLPTKGTLRSRYPEMLPMTSKNEVEVFLQMEASAEGSSDEPPATYYYVLPIEDITPNDIMDQ